MPLPSAPPARPSHRRPVLRLAYDYAPITGGAAAPGRLPCTYTYDARLPRRSRRSAFHLASDCSSADCASLLPRRSAAVPGRGTPGLTYATGFAAFDGNGNVRALVKADAANPAASGVVERYAYDGFGRELPSPSSLVPSLSSGLNPFRFSTKQLDAETGMNCYGYRYYSADAGRWINRDPIGEKGGKNIYAMVGNNGVYLIDVLGMFMTVMSHDEWYVEDHDLFTGNDAVGTFTADSVVTCNCSGKLSGYAKIQLSGADADPQGIVPQMVVIPDGVSEFKSFLQVKGKWTETSDNVVSFTAGTAIAIATIPLHWGWGLGLGTAAGGTAFITDSNYTAALEMRFEVKCEKDASSSTGYSATSSSAFGGPYLSGDLKLNGPYAPRAIYGSSHFLVGVASPSPAAVG